MTRVRLGLGASLLVAATALCSLAGPPAHADTADSTESVTVATFEAKYTGTDRGEVSSSAAAATIRCTFTYDNPHISTSSGKTKINAHLVGSCTAPVTTLWVRSTMCTSDRDRCGAMDDEISSGKSTVMTGADVNCGPNWRNYQAHGDFSVVWPPGYTPITPQSGDVTSPVNGPFRENASGICVA